MPKLIIIIIALILTKYSASQELDKLTIKNNHIEIINETHYYIDTFTITYHYDKDGKIISKIERPNIFMYPKTAKEITNYFYFDTLLIKETETIFIGDTIIKRKTLLYKYDKFNRLVSKHTSSKDNIIYEIVNYKYFESFNEKFTARLWSTKRYSLYKFSESLTVPHIFLDNKKYYLQDYKIYNDENNINYYKPDFRKDISGKQGFYFSEAERSVIEDDSTKLVIIINPGHNDKYSNRNTIVGDKIEQFTGYPKIEKATYETLMNEKIIKKRIVDYSDIHTETTISYFYNSACLKTSMHFVSKTREKGSKNISTQQSKVEFSYIYFE